jgi:hypothetical protein
VLAYIFWHRPYPQIEERTYEESIMRFYGELGNHPPPGFLGASSFAIGAVPWIGGERGYEDWCLLEGSWAMDPLNGFAISGPRQPSHDHVAAQMAEGAGGLYTYAGGEILRTPQSTVYWLTRPRGIHWQADIAPLRDRWRDVVVWRRQMLGTGRRICRRSPGRSGDRSAARLATALLCQARAAAAITHNGHTRSRHELATRQ